MFCPFKVLIILTLLNTVQLDRVWQPSATSTSGPLNDRLSAPQTPCVQEAHRQSLEPVGEPWYLGNLNRKEAERLLNYDGDFLVRASSNQNQPHQFVLSGVHRGQIRHLLLINPEGQVQVLMTFFTSSMSHVTAQ